MKHLKFIFTLGILLLGVCCNDIQDVEEDIIFSQTITLEDINYSPVFTNPYEDVGVCHNEGLKNVFDNYHKSSTTKSDTSPEAILDELMIDFFSSEKFIGNVYIPKDDSELFLKRVKIRTVTKSNNIDFENTTQQEYCNKIRRILCGEKTITSPQSLILEINKIEKEVEESKLSELEKAQVLVATAVAKHSSIFWMEQMLLFDDNFPIFIKTRTGEAGETGEAESNGWLDWFEKVFMPKATQVLAADFSGAIAGIVEGFIFGGAAGSIVPGAGTVTVAITGAIVDGTRGAIVGSVCEGIGIDWTFWN